VRVRHGLRRRHNWVQLGKFLAVGGSGSLVNLVVFSVAVGPLGAHHLAAATIAFLFAVSNNFWWNRRWTFRARREQMRLQAARFLAVSVVAFLFATFVLELLVSAAVPEIPAQALSILAATPLNFVGSKMWSFDRRRALG
jgi:dolichol-phosphate mannosyltransferase